MRIVREATQADCEYVAVHLRQADIEDIKACGWDNPVAALVASKGVSTVCLCLLDDDGNPAVIFGVAPSVNVGEGHPWLLATDYMDRIPIEFVRRSRRYLKEWHDLYPLLTQHVDFRNHVSASWMLWLGFQIDYVVPRHGPERRPFIHFYHRA